MTYEDGTRVQLGDLVVPREMPAGLDISWVVVERRESEWCRTRYSVVKPDNKAIGMVVDLSVLDRGQSPWRAIIRFTDMYTIVLAGSIAFRFGLISRG